MDPSLAPYLAQHDELLRLARRQASLLTPEAVRAHPECHWSEAQQLVARLKAHLAMEDAVLFPALLEGPDADSRGAARDLEAGQASLKREVGQYRHAWASAERIREAPEAFTQASLGLLRSLGRFLDAQATRLFPLVERI